MRAYQLLLAAVSATALSASAYAADLPTRKGAPIAPAPAYAPAFTWAGPYVGGFAGGNWARVAPDGTPTLNSNGLTAGGLAGWNWGFNGVLIGAEVEAGLDHKSQTVGFNVGGGAIGDRTAAIRGSAEGRARGRIGFGWDRFLLFAAGGASVQDLTLRLNSPNVPGGPFGQEITRWRGGWNVGGGVEWAFSDHWTIRGEYIYDRFGSRTYDFAAQIAPPAGFTSRSVPMQESTARAALIYKF